MTGKFITFEGPDGAGKTTVMNNVVSQLVPLLGDRLLVTREPGGNNISEQIRTVILDKKNTDMDPRTEALLYSASRRQHLVKTIIPALEAGKLVLCDRFVDSSVAYQGAGREIGMNEVYQMNQFATEHVLPYKTLYFDIPVTVGLERIAKYRDKDAVDRLDVETQAFHERVHKGYLEIARNNPNRFIMIDATRPIDEVASKTFNIIKQETAEFFKE